MPDDHSVRVLRTGLALVHEGEVVLPAPGSEAHVEQIAGDTRSVIQYHFPVEIEVRGAAEVDVESIVQATLNRLAAQLENR